MPRAIQLISFGFMYSDPPRADRVEDLRGRLPDPAELTELLHLDGLDSRVQAAVLEMPGVAGLLLNLVAYAEIPGDLCRVAIGCAAGRHRAPALVELVAAEARRRELGDVRVQHLHLNMPRY